MKNPSVLKHIFHNAFSFKKYTLLILIVVTFVAIETSLWPYVSKVLIDKISSLPHEEIFSGIWPTALFFIILTILPGFVWRIADYGWAFLTPLIKKKIMIESTQAMLAKSQNFYQNNQAGACANRIRELSNNTPRLLQTILFDFFGVTLGIFIAFYTLFTVHKFFAFSLIIWAVLFILMAIRSAKLSDEMSGSIAKQQAKIMGNVVDIFSNIQNVKFFTNEEKEKNRVSYLQNRYSIFFKHRSFFLLRFYTIHGLTFSLYFSVSIIALIYFYSKKEVTIGDFALIFTINNWMINSMWNAANQMQSFLEDFGAAKQALLMINRPVEVQDVKNADTLKILEKNGAEISFEDVRFSYRNLSQPSSEIKPINSQEFSKITSKNAVLIQDEDLHIEGNFTIKRGEKIGLVGHSGGGKTTFVNLIMRAFDVDSGKILIDGQDIKKVTQKSLRQNITIIPQDPLLFHRSLYENIAYARNNATEEEVFQAAKLANCEEFIKKQSRGYKTLVGDRGIKLSGGQRQRIAIARAFLEDAPILIMDESTSQLDSITENLIQKGLDELMKNRTAIIVAHRLVTLKNVDRILVFDDGNIIENGSHQELIALGGVYKKMWNEQIGGFLTSRDEI